MPNILPASPLIIVLVMLFTFLAFFVATFIVILLIRGLEQGKRGASPRTREGEHEQHGTGNSP